MNDYISREAAVKYLRYICRILTVRGGKTAADILERYAIRKIENKDSIPAADVVEVQYGRWELIDKTYVAQDGWEYRRYRCSLRHRTTVEPDNYCPRCGAKMDGGADNETN